MENKRLECNRTILLFKILGNLALCHLNKGDMVRALKYEYESIKYGDDKSKSVPAFNIGTILIKARLKEETKESFDREKDITAY